MLGKKQRFYRRLENGEDPYSAAIGVGYSEKYAMQLKNRYHAKNGHREKAFSQNDIISSLAEIAVADISDFVTVKDGVVIVRDIDDLPPEKRRVVALIKGAVGGKCAEIRLYDKMKALELLGKFIELYHNKYDTENDMLRKLDDVMAAVGNAAEKDITDDE